MTDRPLLMIPGPIEVSDAVFRATCVRPPSHVAPDLIAAFGDALRGMRSVWLAGPNSQPFVVAGGGTLAMETAATNLVDPGQSALVIDTGYFGDRMAEMLRRRGANVTLIEAPPGETVSAERVGDALRQGEHAAVFATHVDTSTGVRVDARGIAEAARQHGVLSCFDGVCATAAERFEQRAWGADVYLTASQKAIGLPAGLALWVCSARATDARAALKQLPPLTLDWHKWQPIMEAYEAGKPSYFSTPATTLIGALHIGLRELVPDDLHAATRMEARVAAHQRAADAMRAAWSVLGLKLLPTHVDHTANTLSALYYPDGVDASVLGAIKQAGAIVAGGLHADLKTRYFRVGHMGDVVGRPEALLRTVQAVATGLRAVGHTADVRAAVTAAESVLKP